MSCGHLFYPECGCPVVPTGPMTGPGSRASVNESGRRKPPHAGDTLARALAALVTLPKEKRDEAVPTAIRQLEVEAYRVSLAEFVKAGWHVIEADTPLQWNWHHQLLCDTVQALLEDWMRAKDDPAHLNAIRNVAYNFPPGSLKSRLLAVFMPVWMWMRRPGWKIICLSVNDKASLRDGRASRQLIRSRWFQEMFTPSWQIRDDQDSISSYGNTAGGERLSQAMGSEIVGLRADCVAGETLVEIEPPPGVARAYQTIAELHAMGERGEVLPRALSVDPSGATSYQRIVATRMIPARPMIDLDVEDDLYSNSVTAERITCTTDHRFLTPNGYVAARHMVGKLWRDPAGRWQRVVAAHVAGVHDAYDIQVDTNHNFFAAGMCVHNCILVDDANNPIEAENKNERDKINELWTTNTYNRVNDMRISLRISVQQRVNDEDFTGFLVKTDKEWSPENRNGWLVVALPAEFEPERKYVTPTVLRDALPLVSGRVFEDPRAIPGETIDKERFPPDVIESEKRRFGSKYAGQMQQRPTLASGGAIKRNWFGFFRLARGVMPEHDELGAGHGRPAGCRGWKDPDEAPAYAVKAQHHAPGRWEFDSIDISIDCANKKTVRGSNYGIIVGGVIGQRKYVLEDATRRGEFHEIVNLVCELIAKWRANRVLIEDKAAGPTLITTLQNAINDGIVKDVEGRPVSCYVERIPANGQFEERVDAAAVQMKQGLLLLLDGAEWLKEFVDELCAYPNGAHDDRIDATSQWLTYCQEATTTLPDW